MWEIKKMQGRLSAWLVKHGIIHRSLGFDYQKIETLQIKSEDWHSIAVILYVMYMHLADCWLVRIILPEYGVDQPEKVCILKYLPQGGILEFRLLSSVDFQERESYDMLGISYDNHPPLKRILMPESWIGWPLGKDYIVPNLYEIQDAH
ncbi:NAD(P)H-quinone oxidoreductase subunit J [Striga asiatica]|uniref:NAD(P)H-quinone oxidoreductase subunit J n=1 Tax=Striga asiatica TaxID=4170 RepID=A0A5A7RB41_STRAF|nr:NAD(P)H-quinone oxidoreductase subunit J [Striga asiatica]